MIEIVENTIQNGHPYSKDKNKFTEAMSKAGITLVKDKLTFGNPAAAPRMISTSLYAEK